MKHYLKQYQPIFILGIIDIICIITFNMNSRVLENGMLEEPFFLVPIIWLLTVLVLVMAVVTTVRLVIKKIKYNH